MSSVAEDHGGGGGEGNGLITSDVRLDRT